MSGMKKILIIIFFIICQVSFAQGLKVVDVKETVSGSDAFHAPIDENGHPCGLVKVLAVFPDLRFDGNVVGDVAPENNEYKVYLAKGSKQLVIKRSGVLPVIVDFPTCGIPEISSKATYTVKLKEVSLNSQKNSIVIDTKPRNAKVYIDDILIDNEHGDGGYQLLLPKGDHLCKVEAKGYRSYASVVKSGKGQQTINAELESLLADIDISCQTSGAHLFVDGEEVGIGSWKGKLPAGSYKVEASLEGYLPITQSIELSEKDNQILNLPSLKRAKGNISVQTNIKDADVYLDGNRVNNPKHIPDVQTGNHILKVKAPFGYKEVEKDITISSEDNKTIQIDMEPIDELYAKAFGGDIKAQSQICNMRMKSSRFVERDSIERNYWFEEIFKNLDKLDKQHFDLICPCENDGSGCDLSQAGIYTYFSSDTPKALRILHVWNNFKPEYGNDTVVSEIAWLYIKQKKYDTALEWGIKGLDVAESDMIQWACMGYVADACIRLGNAERAVKLFKEHISKEFGWEFGYISIGDGYKEMGDCRNAVTYYKKFLQSPPSGDYFVDEVKKRIKDCGY